MVDLSMVGTSDFGIVVAECPGHIQIIKFNFYKKNELFRKDWFTAKKIEFIIIITSTENTIKSIMTLGL